MLMSQLGMAVSQIALGVYFYILAHRIPVHIVSDSNSECSNTTVHNVTYISDDKEVDLKEKYSWIPLPLIMIFTTAFNLGLGSLTWVVATEILPDCSRGWTHAIANVTSNLCWFSVTKTFKDLQEHLGHCAPFFFYGSVCVFGFVFIYVFLPETRGKTCEETALEFVGLSPIIERIGGIHITTCFLRCIDDTNIT